MKRSIDWCFLGLGLIALSLLLFFLAGCDARAQRVAPKTDSQAAVAQAVADAQSGLEAFARAAGVTYDQAAAKILEGAKEYNLAAAGKTTIPQPHMSPDEILANPDAYHSAAVTAREKADGTFWKIMAAAGVPLVLGAIAKGLSLIPGPVGQIASPIAGMIANAKWWGLSTTQQKEADARQAEIAGHAQSVASAVDSAIPGWRDKLPPSAVASINAILGKPS